MTLYAVFGPTGSGKTEVAVALAAELGTEVVNCDPAQCYRGLPILTNQPGPEHDAVAPHRMIGVWGLDHVASFVNFAAQAHAEIDELVERTGSAVACGGSGLYLQAALTSLPDGDAGGAPEHDPAARAELERRFDAEGGIVLHGELAKLDPDVAARVHRNDRIRIVRALEVAARGESISPAGGSHWDAPRRHTTQLIGLQVERPVIRDRIDARTRRMFEVGVLDEVAALAGPDGSAADTAFSGTARKLHGLDDILGVLRGEWSQARAIELMSTRTRQYAKRQDTWARRWPGLTWVDATDADVSRIVATIQG
ncbi:MAG: tRNA delta(2)-isopentenylpyrophosphate transferase [Thermoleophilia bacterium]|nr:tRNA delta(2)-isopentenylpyrophosphate transferase [Thermoleophilia bacterium]MCZ4496937.1 tRNA delta(2)-isopentenylpyrophosphate transferase [Thermoleophilia bacterium]